MPAALIDLPRIVKGQDFSYTLAWYSDVLTWKPIVGITKGGPCTLNVTGHGLVDGQPFWVEGASGMRQINRDHRECDPYFAAIVDTDHVAINDLSSWEFGTHIANTGSIVYPTARDLAGFTFRAKFRTSPDATGTPVISLDTADGTIVADNSAKTIEMKIGHAVTAGVTQQQLYYELDAIDAASNVTPIAAGWSPWISDPAA